jgi:hypothetical protein
MLKEKIGMICVALSLSTLNMDFLIPFGFMAAGLWLMRGFAE